jgi:hypothetical protein
MKTALRVIRIVVGICVALAATVFGVTKIAVSGSVFSWLGAGVCIAAVVSWACLRPYENILRVLRIVIGVWFALWTVVGVVLLFAAANERLGITGVMHDTFFLAFLTYACLQPEGKALVKSIRARQAAPII